MKFNGPHEQIKRARERLSKSEREMAAAIGINVPSYYDLEEHIEEAEYVLSMRELAKLCRVLRVSPTFIFRGERACPPAMRISFADVAEAIKNYCQKHKIVLDRFEEKVGWAGLEVFLRNPDAAWEFCVDELRDICEPLKLDWLAILTTEFSQ